MGQAAQNERLKLRATFYNNIGAGMALAGIGAPFLSIYFQSRAYRDGLDALSASPLLSPEGLWAATPIMGAFVALCLAYVCRGIANRILGNIAD